MSASCEVTEPSAEQRAALFEALIVPHRSLTRRGLWLGHWRAYWSRAADRCAVLDVGRLARAAIRRARDWARRGDVGALNARQARGSELILLSETELRIVRTEPSGQRREKVLPSGWLTVWLEERDGECQG